ncbi:hypothetical protein HOP50_12g65760 [Chloropicon primus]|nr:hypothetical protein HOP50_12g65760 [Chloropicon primus]
MSDKDHNGDMVSLLGPKKAKKVKEKVATTKRVFISQDRWVLVASVAILIFSFMLVSLSGYVTNLRQEDVKQAMYTYEQQIFQKKIEIYQEEYRVKGVQVTELENRIEILEKELREAYNQVSFANMQLEKASRMLGEENIKIKQLDNQNKGLAGELKKKIEVLEGLQSDLSDETKEHGNDAKEKAALAEEKRLLEKEMRGKNAKIAHLEKRVEELKGSYQALQLQITELEVKEQLESEELAVLKESISANGEDTDAALDKALEDLKDLLKKDEDESGDGSSGDTSTANGGDGDGDVDDDEDDF